MSVAADQPRSAVDFPRQGAFGEIADGIFAINVPLPFRGLRQAALWLLRGPEGWTMIDCGWGDAATRETIERAWDALLGDAPLVRLLVTHFHPDHMGNCRWICDRWGILPHVTRNEWFAAKASERLMYIDDIDSQAGFFATHGVDPELISRYRREFLLYDKGVSVAPAHIRLRDGQRLSFGGSEWEVMTAGGHSPEMATFYCAQREIYISADQVLPRITSNVGVNHWEPCGDPLAEFLASLSRIGREVSPGALVLPSHGEPFRDAPGLIARLERHHEERLAHVMAAFEADESRAAGECMALLFGKELDGTQIGFAAGETVAHLNHLVMRGELERVSGPDGTLRYRKKNGNATQRA